MPPRASPSSGGLATEVAGGPTGQRTLHAEPVLRCLAGPVPKVRVGVRTCCRWFGEAYERLVASGRRGTRGKSKTRSSSGRRYPFYWWEAPGGSTEVTYAVRFSAAVFLVTRLGWHSCLTVRASPRRVSVHDKRGLSVVILSSSSGSGSRTTARSISSGVQSSSILPGMPS
ncbi:DUF6416 domain-containing protein [Streptomyces sp. NPDC059224]|uniref:DUF6416 domain-containing protein n=1 Tax=Streptomyces sp. NPDC059224 TaxID=3346775 RepID=UPI0036AA19BF